MFADTSSTPALTALGNHPRPACHPPSTTPRGRPAQGQLQIFNLEAKSRLKSHTISEPIVFWRWFDATTIALVTASAVFHWSMEGDSGPQKIFNRDAKLEGCQVSERATCMLVFFCAWCGVWKMRMHVGG